MSPSLPSFKNRPLFSYADEIVNSTLPILFLALAVISLIFPIFQLKFNEASKFLVINVILLNVTHGTFTFIMLAKLPQFQLWKSQFYKHSQSFYWKLILIGSVGFFQFYIINSGMTLNIISQQQVIFIFSILVIILQVHHGLSQSKGLALAYSELGREPTSPSSSKFERVAFGILILLVIFQFDSTLTSMIKQKDYYFSALSATIVFSIVGRSIYQFGFCAYKTLYLQRLWLIPLLPFSQWALIGFVGYHGIEYFFVFKKMSQNAISEKKVRNKYWMKVCYTASIASIFILFYGINLEPFSKKLSDVYLALVPSFFWGMIFIHYYLDQMFFSFRFPEAKKHIYPLLLYPNK